MDIQEVFGQYAVQLEDGVELFDSKEEAALALADFENGAESLRLATSFTDSKGLEGKNAKGKINVIVEFLNWVATQSDDSDEEVPEVVTSTEGEEEGISF